MSDRDRPQATSFETAVDIVAAGVPGAEAQQVVEVRHPDEQTLPIVVSSPHSGRAYPGGFVAEAAVDLDTLRSSEDSYVDELFAGVPGLGAPLLRALFPRVYVDVNRAAYELDPDMFVDELPDHVTTRNARISAGLGTIAKVVANARPVYRRKLTWAEAEDRIHRYYLPYHAALAELIEITRARFGYCILIDCHSMPSGAVSGRRAIAAGLGGGGERVDIVLGDCHGIACDGLLTDVAERALAARNYRVRRNSPYAGGHITRHYGRPVDGVHALQIEINRSLYMDERRLSRRVTLRRVAADMAGLVSEIAAVAEHFAPPAEAAQ